MRAGVKMGVQAKDWKEAAIRASNLSELELTLGEVAGAVADAAQSVTHADRSGKDDWQNYIRTRTTHADALHQAGRWVEAKRCSREVERMQVERQPAYRCSTGARLPVWRPAARRRRARRMASRSPAPAGSGVGARVLPKPAAPSPSARRRRSSGPG